MKIRHLSLFLVVAAALLLQACAGVSDAEVQTRVAQTLEIAGYQTALAGGQPLASDTPQPGAASDTPAATATPSQTPTITLTPTPSVPMVSVGENTNCRRGPSTDYSIVMVLNVGEQAEVLKVFGSNYVVIRNIEGSGDCWLWLQYATPSGFAAYNLPAATQPPTPTPTYTPTPSFDWDGPWNIKAINGGSTYTGTMDCDLSGSNISCDVVLNPGALPYTFNASLSGNMQTASGTFSGTGSGDWDGQIKSGNMNQFVGNLDASGTIWEFCGWRSGSSSPSPCQWP